jgi:hypothetical protein
MWRIPAGVSGLSPVLRNPPASPFVKGGIGIKGVDDGHEDGAGGFRFALPTLHVDSRLRGNDKTGAAERCRGLGCPQIPLFSSPKSGGQGVEKSLPGQPRQHRPALATTHREAQTFYSVPDPGHRIPDSRGKRSC